VLDGVLRRPVDAFVVQLNGGKRGRLGQLGQLSATRRRAPPSRHDSVRSAALGVPKSALRRVAQVKKVLSFRVEGEQAFLIFKGAGGALKYAPMASEGGEWKVAAIEPTEFFLGPVR
jgi:hypothetical protein